MDQKIFQSIFDFLQLGLLTSQAICCLIGVLNWKKLYATYWKWFIVGNIILFIGEATTFISIYLFRNYELSTIIYFKLTEPLAFILYFWIYIKFLAGSRLSKIPGISIMLYIISLVLNIFVLDEFVFGYLPFSFVVGVCLLLIVIVSAMLYFIFSSSITTYRHEMIYWFSLGLLIYHLVHPLVYALSQVNYTNRLPYILPLIYLQYFVCFLLYAFFSIGLIWSKKK